MKKGNFLKILVFVVAVILVSLVSFVGIYKYDKGSMVNILPNYELGKDFGGYRLVTLNVSDETKTVEVDTNTEENTEGQATENEEKTDENTEEEKKTQEVPVNSNEVLTKDNYKLSKQIIETRLKNEKVQEYSIRLNEENGNIVLEIPETDTTDDIIGFLIEQGDFNIISTDTEEVLLNKTDIENAQIMYSNGTTGTAGTTVYISIQFKKDAVKKLEDITKEYIETTDEEGNSTKKTITIKIDDQTFMTTYFGETISSGLIQIPVGNASNDINEINETVKAATYITTLLNNKTIPIAYETGENQYVSALVDEATTKLLIVSAIVIVTCVILCLIIKYKEKGILAGILLVGVIALLMLVARLTNVVITIESIAAIALSIIAEVIFLIQLIKAKTVKEKNESLIKILLTQIPLYIIAFITCLFSWLPIVSFGTMLFWGLLISLACNFLFKFIIGNEE